MARRTREITFTSLGELRDFLARLPEEELYAVTNEHDWYTVYVAEGFNGTLYFAINGHDGGEE